MYFNDQSIHRTFNSNLKKASLTMTRTDYRSLTITSEFRLELTACQMSLQTLTLWKGDSTIQRNHCFCALSSHGPKANLAVLARWLFADRYLTGAIPMTWQPVVSSEAFFKIKLNVCLDTTILKIYIFKIIQVHNFRGYLSDISARRPHWLCHTCASRVTREDAYRLTCCSKASRSAIGST